MQTLTPLLNDFATSQPVNCLSLTFANEEARRAYFLELLRDKLQDADFRKMAGFPQTTDEAILALSDPPYYTACPNPWLTELLKEWESERMLAEPGKNNNRYHREPFTADVSEGKNDPFYNAHSYHAKVPHKAVMRYILHYTEPGDVVFDGFCGTGMTGVAAQLCGNQKAVEELGYRVLTDGTIEAQEEDGNGKLIWKPFSQLGARHAILNDLSPVASFIAYNYNTPVDILAFEQLVKQVLLDVEIECGFVYQTLHTCTQNTQEYATKIKKVLLGKQECPAWINLGRINYVIHSQVFVCPQCTGEVVFWETAVDKAMGKVKEQFSCPHCNATLTKRQLERAWVVRFDKVIQQTLRQVKQVPVLINYSIGNQRFEKSPDEFDLALWEQIDLSDIPYWFPNHRMPEGDESRRNDAIGITHLHHFYTKRNLWILATLVAKSSLLPSQGNKAIKNSNNYRLNALLQLLISSYNLTHSTIMSRIIFKKSATTKPILTGYQSGTLYISSLPVEKNILEALSHKKVKLFSQALSQLSSRNIVSCQSSSQINLPDNSIDYIFLDPPFGANLMYSELNFIWEAWLNVFTNIQSEAIVNKTQRKTLSEYHHLMVACFKEVYRILKPGHWLTVEFSNTQARVWNTLQTALSEAGFVVANVSALDKQQGSFKAVTTTTAVKQDLIISAYKPDIGLEKRFETAAGSEAGVWEFVCHHLNYLPLTKSQSHGELEFIAEREPRILYDRTVAYFIGHGYPVPLSSQAFQAELKIRFTEKDGMIFLPEQLEFYEQKRKQAQHLPQFSLFVSDERSAIDWLHNYLEKHPATRQQIHPEFTKQLGAGWKSYEVMPELDTLLEFNFLQYEGTGEVPSQIHNYLSQHYPNCHNLTTTDPVLQQHATARWYVPDPNKAIDLEKLRDTQLLREFKQYRQAPHKRLKTFRLEAMRAGFKQAWAQKDYQTIIDIAAKIPSTVLYEDEKLLQLYDLAMTRLEGI